MIGTSNVVPLPTRARPSEINKNRILGWIRSFQVSELSVLEQAIFPDLPKRDIDAVLASSWVTISKHPDLGCLVFFGEASDVDTDIGEALLQVQMATSDMLRCRAIRDFVPPKDVVNLVDAPQMEWIDKDRKRVAVETLFRKSDSDLSALASRTLRRHKKHGSRYDRTLVLTDDIGVVKEIRSRLHTKASKLENRVHFLIQQNIESADWG